VTIESPARRNWAVFRFASDGSPKPLRVHCRAPSYIIWQALPKLIEGQLIADVIACIGTIDIVLWRSRQVSWNFPLHFRRSLKNGRTAIPLKRSALIPMLLYAQDEYGRVSDEMIAEIGAAAGPEQRAGRGDAGVLLNAASQPWGKHHVQICTNVACMLKAGTELLERAKSGWRSGTRSDGRRRLLAGRSGMHRRMHGAPAMQVNYDFYENLTALKFDRIIEDLDAGKHPAPESVISGALHDRHVLETPLNQPAMGMKDSHKSTFT